MQPNTTPPSATQDTAPTSRAFDTTIGPPLRRRRRRWIIAIILLLLLAVLFEFNPLHPIAWWQHTTDEVRQGWEAEARDQHEAQQRAQREAQQAAQHHSTPATSTTPQ